MEEVSQRYPKAARLRKRPEYLRVQREGFSIKSRWCVMLLHPRASECARLGVVASKRAGGAVQRNRLKRRVREWFRHLPTRPAGVDVVVIVHGRMLELEWAALCKQLDRSLDRGLRRLAGGRG